MTKQKKQLLLIILFLAAVAAVRFSPLRTIISFDNVKQHRDALLAFVQGNYWLSAASFMAMYLIAASFPVPLGLILTLIGGFLFGTAAAVLYVNIGATIGASFSFLFARYLLGNRLQEKYQQQLRNFNDEMHRNGSHYLLTVRLIPVFPFFVINFLAGLTKVPLKTFIWTTSLGIIPGSTVFAFAGRQLGTINSPAEILSKNMLIAFLALALITLLPVVLKRIKGRNRAPDR